LVRFRDFVAENLWKTEPLEPRPLGWLRSFFQLAVLIAEGFVRDELLLRAHSLAYLTLLSIVPLLALAVVLIDLVGDGPAAAAQILDLLAVAPDAKANFLERVGQFNFRALGGAASALLLATMILAVGRVEQALNALWGVTERRPWSRRIPDYLAVIVIAPLTLGGAISMRAALESQTLVQKALEFPLLHLLYRSGLRWAPVVLVISALTFLYWFLPNTRVRPRSALLGGLVAGVLFNAAQVAYVALTLGAKARLDEAFAASAWVVMFLIWVYIAWAVVLLGAEVAYAHQTLSLYRREVQGKAAGTAARETIGLAIALCCARAFHDGTQPWHPDALSDSLDVPLRTVREVLRSLEQAGIVAPCGGESVGSYQMARPAEQVRVSDVLVALRGNPAVPLGVAELSRTANAIIAEVEHAGAAAAGSRSLRDLLSAAPADTRAHA
jgi:membrane protein